MLLNDDCVCEPGFVERDRRRARSGRRGRDGRRACMRDGRRPELIDTPGWSSTGPCSSFDYLNGEPVSAARTPGPPIRSAPRRRPPPFDRERSSARAASTSGCSPTGRTSTWCCGCERGRALPARRGCARRPTSTRRRSARARRAKNYLTGSGGATCCASGACSRPTAARPGAGPRARHRAPARRSIDRNVGGRPRPGRAAGGRPRARAALSGGPEVLAADPPPLGLDAAAGRRRRIARA